MLRSALALGVLMAVTILPHAAVGELTTAEFGCEDRTEVLLWKSYAAKSKCIVPCQEEARAGKHPFSNCAPPFAQDTQGCVNGISGKIKAKFCKACNNNEPECYGSGPCPGAVSDT